MRSCHSFFTLQFQLHLKFEPRDCVSDRHLYSTEEIEEEERREKEAVLRGRHVRDPEGAPSTKYQAP